MKNKYLTLLLFLLGVGAVGNHNAYSSPSSRLLNFELHNNTGKTETTITHKGIWVVYSYTHHGHGVSALTTVDLVPTTPLPLNHIAKGSSSLPQNTTLESVKMYVQYKHEGGTCQVSQIIRSPDVHATRFSFDLSEFRNTQCPLGG